MPSKLVATSIALGLLALVVLRLHLTRLEERITGGATIKVLALTTDLAPGAELTREVLLARELPQAFLESRHVGAGELEDVLGSELAVGVRASETLHWTDLASMRPRLRQLSSLVPRGMRGITLHSVGRASGSLLRPGDRVDVLRTGAAVDAELVLQDVIVLAVGEDLGGAAGEPARGAGRSDSVTVSVTVEQAQKLASAEQVGALRLVLRNPDDIALGNAGHAAEGAP